MIAATLHKNAIKLFESAITRILDENNVISTCVSQGGDDFHFYTTKNPELAATMLGLGCDLSDGLHHPQMKFNLEALRYGTKILTKNSITSYGSLKRNNIKEVFYAK